MERKKQRIVSLIIGLILAALLIYIGVRIVQRRSSRASQPETFTVERVDATTCRPTAVTLTDTPILLRYGETAETFYFRYEASNIEKKEDGTFSQVADVRNLGAGQINFLVEGHEDIKAVCDAFSSASGDTGSADEPDALAGSDEPLVEPTTTPEITEAPVEEAPDPTPTEAVSTSRTGLPKATADAFFAEDANSDADFTDCNDEFQDEYYGVVQVCNEAWRDAQ